MTEQDSTSRIEIVIVGSIGLDTIETKFNRQIDVLGGSVSYACAASAMYAETGMVGVVGDDFPGEYMDLYREFGINLDGLVTEAGKTFRWSGVYDDDMINRRTISTDLNVFETFQPELPPSYLDVPFLLLGNISPELQLHVLASAREPEFVVADTMDLWINIARDPLMEVISKVNMLTLNDSEIRLLTGEHNLKKCAQIVREWGPEYVVVKKGEHGAMLLSEAGIFLVPAYPVDEVQDPTGAGDSFAGGFMGRLASVGTVDNASVRDALLTGAVVASFGVEAFSLESLKGLTADAVNARLAELKAMITL
ncbi:MAG: PfkB family carbohydrate kinase [Kiritimatiellia bacterium]|jgi:sugar/nucleoside kinase (ribokinase family)|nr:PfkB family carbohydrate kinase [Kiritimatiellia bacterium]MDP6848342.1 PfkB family carbohydrate kinase [Kiritimatiellia bacterium]